MLDAENWMIPINMWMCVCLLCMCWDIVAGVRMSRSGRINTREGETERKRERKRERETERKREEG